MRFSCANEGRRVDIVELRTHDRSESGWCWRLCRRCRWQSASSHRRMLPPIELMIEWIRFLFLHVFRVLQQTQRSDANRDSRWGGDPTDRSGRGNAPLSQTASFQRRLTAAYRKKIQMLSFFNGAGTGNCGMLYEAGAEPSASRVALPILQLQRCVSLCHAKPRRGRQLQIIREHSSGLRMLYLRYPQAAPG